MSLSRMFARTVNMRLTASPVSLLVLGARLILRKAPKVYSYALWAVILFRLLCPVSLPSPVSLLGLLDAPATRTEGIISTVEYIPYHGVETREEAPFPDPVAGETYQSQQNLAAMQKKSLSPGEIAPYVWLAGAIVLVIAGITGEVQFRRRLTGAIWVRDNIYLADHMDSAFVVGLFCPKIYLPSEIPMDRMDYIIAHERHYIRRGDYIVKHLAFLALCIHWFNPLVWLAFVLSGMDMEMSCDEAVIRELGEGIRAEYSASLLSLATGHRILSGTPLAF